MKGFYHSRISVPHSLSCSELPYRTLGLCFCFFLIHFSFQRHSWFLPTVQNCSETEGVITEMYKLTLFLWSHLYNKIVMNCAFFVQTRLCSAGYAELCSIYFLFTMSKITGSKLDINCPANCSTYLSIDKTKCSCFWKLFKQWKRHPALW